MLLPDPVCQACTVEAKSAEASKLPTGFEVRRAVTRAELDAARQIRYEVFCLEQHVPAVEERDGRDRDGVHLIALKDGEVVATCRLVFVGSTVQLSRLAVTRSARRQGIATALLEASDREALAGSARRIVLHAQTYARSLYDQAGYLARGRTFVEANIEHVAMEKLL